MHGHADEDLVRWLETFVADQPGCAHPLSDRHAVSLIPLAVVLANQRDLLGQ